MNEMLCKIIEKLPLHITQHKRFMSYGTHTNSIFGRTSFMLELLDEIAKRGINIKIN